MVVRNNAAIWENICAMDKANIKFTIALLDTMFPIEISSSNANYKRLLEKRLEELEIDEILLDGEGE